MYLHVCPNVVFLLLFKYVLSVEQIPFDTIVSFGDSNTDSGNVYRLTNQKWPLVPPYYQGRFSNGLVWIERLGVSDIQNYAYGGATSDNKFIQGYTASDTVPVPGVRQQISIYFNQTNGIQKNFARRLYVIWVGGNDYYFNSTLPPAKVSASILNAVKDLLNIGVKHLLVLNQSPMENIPFVQTEDRIVYYRQRTIYHNNNLSIGIKTLDYNRQKVQLYFFDTYSFLLRVFTNYSQHSLNTRVSCWNLSNGQIVSQCSNPQSYMYIDQYHLTTTVHELIGNEIRKFLVSFSTMSQAFVPTSLILCALFFLLSDWSF